MDLETILDKLVSEWAPAALELGIRMTYLDAVASIIEGIIALVATFVCVHYLRRLVRLQQEEGFIKEMMDFEGIIHVAKIIAMCIALVVSFIFFLGLFNVWNWIALFDPRTALAHDIYTKLVK